jgi:hypothetical protein
MEEKLNQLAKDLYDAKRTEETAKEKRIACEEAIAALVETGDNGSKTVPAGEGLKVTVKRALSYKAAVDDIRAMTDIADEIKPLKLTDPVPAGYVFDEKAYEALRESHPEAYTRLATVVTAVPRKVSVTLKLA